MLHDMHAAVGRGSSCHSALLQFLEKAGISYKLACIIITIQYKKFSILDWENSNHRPVNIFLPLHIVPSILLYRLGILEHTNATT
jgi:hypothetical protein